MKYCPKYTGFLIGDNAQNTILLRTRCKQWTCPYCSIQNKRQWQARMLQTVNAHKNENWAFYTLTAHKMAKNWHTSLLNLQSGWKPVRERIRYASTKAGIETLLYARVYEQHKDGRAHWHMIMNWLPGDYVEPKKPSDRGSRWLSDTCAEAGMGWKTHVVSAKVQNAGYVVSYCTKYMTKLSETMPKNTRRVQTSHGWQGEPSIGPSDYKWQTSQMFSLRDASHYWRQGKTLTDADINHVITADDFDASTYYDNTPTPENSPLIIDILL